MKNIKLTPFLALIFCANIYSQELTMTAYSVKVKAQHVTVDNIIKVRYQVFFENNNTAPVVSFSVGKNAISNYVPMVKIPDAETNQISIASPAGWVGKVNWLQETLFNSFDWVVPWNDPVTNGIAAGTSNNQFFITTPKRYQTIFNAFVAVDEQYSTKVVRWDTVPPTGLLSAFVAPVRESVQRVTKYKINLTVNASDNYDPKPEILFENIVDISRGGETNNGFAVFGATANRANDPSTGQYPTVFEISAHPSLDKTYRATYLLTDASGNERRISTTFVVPKL